MDSPKQKPKMTKPKVLDKSKNLMDKTRQSTDKPRERNADEYAINRAEETIGRGTELVAHGAVKVGKKAMSKGREQIQNRIYKHRQTEYAKKFAEKQTATESTKQTVKNAIHTGKKQTIKTAKNTAKATQKGVKTGAKGAKGSIKTAKKSAHASKNMAIATKKAMITATKTAKTVTVTTAKAVVTTIKATIVALKALISAIAAGGWVAIVVIIIVGAIMYVLASPFGLFSNQSDGETPIVTELVQQINGEYANEITSIINSSGDIDELIIEGETSSSDYTPNNWIDVLSVFAVKVTNESETDEYLDVLFLDDSKADLLREVFWSMNDISYEIIEEEIELEPTPIPSVTVTPSITPDTSPTPEPTPEIYITLIITATGKTYEDGADTYEFDEQQMALLEEMMTPYYLGMFMEICGMNTYIGLTPDQVVDMINNQPEGDLGATIVEYALSRLGHPYSQPRRGLGNYVDCSYLTRWCYSQAGVSSFIAGTAAEQARYCVDNGYAISKSNLIPGDLIFWSFNTNGRYLNITHTGIYAGNGYVIDASSSRGMVVYRPIFGESSIVVCGRPHLN